MNKTPKLLGRTRTPKTTLPPLIATEVIPVGSGQRNRIKTAARHLVRIRRKIATYALIEKKLASELITLTGVGRLVLTDKRGMPVMKINHLHFEKALVEAYMRGSYDSIL